MILVVELTELTAPNGRLAGVLVAAVAFGMFTRGAGIGAGVEATVVTGGWYAVGLV
jgi:hypothetical protein